MDESLLFNRTYDHLSFESLNKLQEKSMIRGLPLTHVQDNSCEGFILGKHHRDNFPKEPTYRAKVALELVHIDPCGPMHTQLVGGSFHLLEFIDDYSMFTWIYLLKNKSKTFGRFRELKAMVEKQSGKYIAVLRSDGGGEYDSNKFTEYCREQGVINKFTTVYTP